MKPGGMETITGIICTIVQVEKKAGHVLVVDSASSVCFVLGNKLNVQERNKRFIT